MTENSHGLSTVVPIVFTALPILGGLLLLHAQSIRRRLSGEENVGACLMFGGFIVFVFWEGYWIEGVVGVLGVIIVLLLGWLGRKD